MITFPLDLATVERWACTAELDAEFDQHFEEDADSFEHSIRSACSLSDLHRLAADGRCLKRSYFAWMLIEDLCCVYSLGTNLPYEFSRMGGIQSRAEYLSQEARRAEVVYERSEIIERMRLSSDPAMQALANRLLDFRHEELAPQSTRHVNILRILNQDILPLFKRR